MWMPYLVSLLLGRTFDFNQFSAKQDIFTENELRQNTETIKHYTVRTHCSYVQSESQARKMLDVGAAVAVSVSCKAFGASVAISGAYLKDERDRSNSIEYLCKVSYETETRILRNTAKPKSGWRLNYDEKDRGTHYVQSVTYGGEMIASFLFQSNTDHNIKRIAGAMQVGATIVGITGTVGAQFEKFVNEAKTKTTVHVKYYSTTSISEFPYNMQTFNSTIENFSDQVAKVNGGLGVPLRVNLAPLSQVDVGVPVYLENAATEGRLQMFETMLQDLRVTDHGLQTWALTLPVIDDTDEKKIGEMAGEVAQVLSEFYRVGSKLDFTQGPTQIDSAIALYDKYGSGIPYTFSRKFRKLREEISAKVEKAEGTSS